MNNEGTNDNELLDILTELWDTTIIPLYKKGKIQTERHLQSYLFMLLKNRFTEKVLEEWDVWVEPQFYFKDNSKKPNGEKMYKPDLVVTKGHEIAGIIEIKFTPQEWNSKKNLEAAKSDIEKLSLYRSGNPKHANPRQGNPPVWEPFLLNLFPNQGSYNKEKVYNQDDYTHYFFLGIAFYTREEKLEILKEVGEELGERALCLLHATDPKKLET